VQLLSLYTWALRERSRLAGNGSERSLDMQDERLECDRPRVARISFEPYGLGLVLTAPVALLLRRRVLVCKAPLDAMDRTVMDRQLLIGLFIVDSDSAAATRTPIVRPGYLRRVLLHRSSVASTFNR
jgi:hypothetical protein